MRCANCGHNAEQHDDAGSCHITILTGWKDNTGFTGQRPCHCTRYAGRYKTTDSNGCPHELVPTSNLCVHCGKLAVVESES